MIENNKLLGLEVIRFLAACGVLFVHYHHFCHIDPHAPDYGLTTYPFFRSLPFLYALGGMWAVQTFWCLSGFIFFWKYQALIANRALNFKKFFVSRFARLYPLHFVTLFIVAIGQSIYFHMTGFYFLKSLNSAPLFVGQLFMACNRTFMPESFNFPVWSVSVEVLVYLIFFIVACYLTPSIRFNFFIILVFIIASFFKVQGHLHLTSLFECLLFFYTGGIAAILKKHSVLRNFPSRLVWIGAGLTPLAFWFTGGFSSDDTIFLFLAIWLPILMYCASDDFKVNGLVRKIIEVFGNMTYSSYLIHVPIQIVFAVVCFHWGIRLPVYSPLFFVGYLCLILFLSYFIFRYFEVPMKNMIKARAA
jgi:peptidoglycan/LPS O-acetylase OafA/YrhL